LILAKHLLHDNQKGKKEAMLFKQRSAEALVHKKRDPADDILEVRFFELD